MNKKHLEKHLKALHYVQASSALREKIQQSIADLPSRQHTFFPLVAFQMGVALTVILVLLGIGSGIVAAANYSRPGSIFYPVRKAIEALPVKVLPVDMHIVVPTPVNSLIPSVTPVIKKQQNNQHENSQVDIHEKEKDDHSHSYRDVEGITTQSPSVTPEGNNNKGKDKGKFDFGQSMRNFFQHIHSSENHRDN